MLHVFDDLRKTEKLCGRWSLRWGKTGADLENSCRTMTVSRKNSVRQVASPMKQISARFSTALSSMSPWQMKIEELSGGQNTRLALAKMLLENQSWYWTSRPTTWILRPSPGWKTIWSIIAGPFIVSHDRYFLDKVATITLDLTKHSLDRYVGNYSSFVEQKEQKLLTEAKNYEKQQKKLQLWKTLLIVIWCGLRLPSEPSLGASSWKNGASRQAGSWK